MGATALSTPPLRDRVRRCSATCAGGRPGGVEADGCAIRRSMPRDRFGKGTDDIADAGGPSAGSVNDPAAVVSKDIEMVIGVVWMRIVAV